MFCKIEDLLFECFFLNYFYSKQVCKKGFKITHVLFSVLVRKRKRFYQAIGNAARINRDRTQKQQSHALLVNLSLLLEIGH